MVKRFDLPLCPSCDFTCFYCDANGYCMMDNPELECEDYIALCGDEEEEEEE